jgi:hypothetical protein
MESGVKHLSIEKCGSLRIFTDAELRVRRCIQARRWRLANRDWFYPKRNENRKNRREHEKEIRVRGRNH